MTIDESQIKDKKSVIFFSKICKEKLEAKKIDKIHIRAQGDAIPIAILVAENVTRKSRELKQKSFFSLVKIVD